MNEKAQKLLQECLTIFNAKRLGEGDTASGANLLAAMAGSLAGMQLRGSLLTAHGDIEKEPYLGALEIDTHLFASGAHSSALFQGKVIERLAMMHNRLHEEVDAMQEVLKMKNRRPHHDNLTVLAANASIRSSLELDVTHDQQDFTPIFGMKPRQMPLFVKPRNITDLLAHPNILIAASTSPAKFEALVSRSNESRPILHAALSRADHFAQFGWQCTAMMDGLSCPSGGRFIRGTVQASDPGMLLGEAVREGDRSAAWAERMLWLVDGQAGPCPPDIPLEPKGDFLRRVEACYEAALEEAWIGRVSLKEVGPLMHGDYNAWRFQQNWMQFLKTQESKFPGITWAARNLFATLVLGLRLISMKAPQTNIVNVHSSHAYALAMFLVLRMVNHRQALLHDAVSEHHARLRVQLMSKLGDRALSARDLTRRFHRLNSQECHELLYDLESQGLVRCDGGLWFLNPQAGGTGQTITLEVN